MDMKGVQKMADKIAADEDEALTNVETSVDHIIMAVQIIDKNIGNVVMTSPQEKEAIDKIRDLVDSAIAPYIADIAEAFQVFDQGEE